MRLPRARLPPPAPAQPFGTRALTRQGQEHLGTCRRDGNEEQGFKVSPKPQMVLLPHPFPADPTSCQLPSHGNVFLLQPGLVLALIRLSLEMSLFVCLSVHPPHCASCLGASLSPGLVQTGPSWEQPRDILSGAAQLTHPPRHARTRLGARDCRRWHQPVFPPITPGSFHLSEPASPSPKSPPAPH